MSKVIDMAMEFVSIGRGVARQKAPYIATTLHGLVPRAVPGLAAQSLGPMGVTPGLCLYFDPDWIMSDPELQDTTKDPQTKRLAGHERMAASIYHECWHVLNGFDRLDALARKGMRHGLFEKDAQDLANIAGDLAINSMARQAKWLLPKWAAFPERFGLRDGLMTEEYWEELFRKCTKRIRQGGQGDAGHLVLDLPGGDGGAGTPSLGPCAGRCGGGAGNNAQRELEQGLDGQFGRHGADIERIKITTREAIKQHLQTKGRGSAPGFTIEDVTFKKEPPLVPWERTLLHISKRASGRLLAGDDDYSMSRPDKRTAMLGVVLPGLIEQEIEVAFVRDTSGSMDIEQLNYANNEILYVMSTLGVEHVWLLDADYIVHGEPRRVNMRQIPALKVRGRGGTSFVDALEKVSRLRPKPTLTIYMTDGDGDAPARPPRGIEVIWCIVPNSHCRHRPADWGHLVICSNDRTVREEYNVDDVSDD